MPISEEQLQEWEVVANFSDTKGAKASWAEEELAAAVLLLIAELRDAREQLAESKSAYQPDSDHQSRYYVEQQGFWFWVVKCGTGTRTIFKSGTQIGAIEMAQELQTAFLDGEFVGQKAIPALTAAIEEAVAPHLQKLAELENKIEFQNNELVEKQKYILSLERKLAEVEARTAQVLSVAERMRCAGGAQEFQYWFDELKSFLMCKRDAPMLDAAIAAQEKP